MTICFAYNVKHNLNYNVEGDQSDLEFDSKGVIDFIKNTLVSLGHKVIMLEADLDAYEKLKSLKSKVDLVFNIAEGLGGDARESQIPLFCEMLSIPYTHSSPTTHAIKLNKHLTKAVLKSFGVKVPESVIVTKLNDLDRVKLKYPLIVKPNKEGSSKGIFNDSVVRNKGQLERAVKRLLDSFKAEVLVEKYIDGRELTVGLLGNPPKVLPIVEQRFDFLPKNFNKIAGYEVKWIYEDSLEDLSQAYVCPARLSDRMRRKVEQTSLKICSVLNVLDCARIDYRLKGSDLYFIEINTLPGINPDEKVISYFPIAARVAGLTFSDMINTIVKSASRRYHLSY